MLEVVDAIIALQGLSHEEVRIIRDRKREDRGGFDGRIILEES
ncbi:MAG: hypothetical protein WCL23_03835 [Candidatus Moraniibacteriota bacterium]